MDAASIFQVTASALGIVHDGIGLLSAGVKAYNKVTQVVTTVKWFASNAN